MSTRRYNLIALALVLYFFAWLFTWAMLYRDIVELAAKLLNKWAWKGE